MKMRVEVKVTLVLLMLFAARHGAAMCGEDKWVEMDAEATGWRARSPTLFASDALDMNADGVPDKASLVVSADGKRSGVRVCFGGKATSVSRCAVIGESENVAEVMGLQGMAAGCYDYSESDRGVPSKGRKVCSKGDALSYFRFGSSSSFFVYDMEAAKFSRYWDSD